MTFVYVVTNNVNGKRYVGVTGNPTRRWRDHKACARRGSRYLLHQAIAKYGEENFTFEVRESHARRELAIEAEARLIAELNTVKEGYNLSEGGAAPILSEEARANLSASLRRHFQSPEARRKRGDPQLGKSKPRRQRIESGQGRPQTIETRRKLSEYWARRRAERKNEK